MQRGKKCGSDPVLKPKVVVVAIQVIYRVGDSRPRTFVQVIARINKGTDLFTVRDTAPRVLEKGKFWIHWEHTW